MFSRRKLIIFYIQLNEGSSLKQTQNLNLRVIISKVGTWRNTIIKCPHRQPSTLPLYFSKLKTNCFQSYPPIVESSSQGVRELWCQWSWESFKDIEGQKSQKRLKRVSEFPMSTFLNQISNFQTPMSRQLRILTISSQLELDSEAAQSCF